MIDTLADKT
jgi:hypothetical protein